MMTGHQVELIDIVSMGQIDEVKRLIREGCDVSDDYMLPEYQAPKPMRAKRARTLAVVTRVVFPPILAWDMLQ